MEEENFYLCYNCAKDIYLKEYIQEKAATQVNTCTICKKEYVSININQNIKLTKFCRFLIRFHMSEHIYNSHWGGVDFPLPFFEENDIISHLFADKDKRGEEIEDFINCLFDLNSPTYDDLYYGRDEVGRGLFYGADKEKKSFIWKQYKTKLKERNYYLFIEDAKKQFQDFFSDSKYIVPIKSTFYRARIGFSIKKNEDEMSDFLNIEIKTPYECDEISSPPVIFAKAGRLNRQGCSYLYLASQKEVAIGEVRPNPGNYISVAQFKNNIPLTVVDFRFTNLLECFDDKNKLNIFYFIRDIANELSKTVLPEEQEQYLVTQFISDVIRDMGYDGILYKSSIADGYNLLVFDSSKLAYLEKSSELLKIKKLTYDVELVEYALDGFTDLPIEKLKPHINITDKKAY